MDDFIFFTRTNNVNKSDEKWVSNSKKKKTTCKGQIFAIKITASLSEEISYIYSLVCLTDLGYNVGLTKSVFLAQMGKN